MSPAKTVRLRALAVTDVDDAISHCGQDAGPEVALGFIDALQQAYTHLGRHAATGSPRYAPELNLPGLRSWPLMRYPYRVFYVEQRDHVDVWQLLHCARDVPAWLSDGNPGLP